MSVRAHLNTFFNAELVRYRTPEMAQQTDGLGEGLIAAVSVSTMAPSPQKDAGTNAVRATSQSLSSRHLSMPKTPNEMTRFADFLLTPVRYLFGGWSVGIEGDNLVRVRSFTKGVERKTNRRLVNVFHTGIFSETRSWKKAIGALLLLIPGLFLGTIVKALTYVLSDQRAAHRFIKQRLTSTAIHHIGSATHIFHTEQQITECVKKYYNHIISHRVNALVFWGNGSLQLSNISQYPQFDGHWTEFRPKRVVIYGGTIAANSPLELALMAQGWDTTARVASTVKEALSARAPKRTIFTVQVPAAASAAL